MNQMILIETWCSGSRSVPAHEGWTRAGRKWASDNEHAFARAVAVGLPLSLLLWTILIGLVLL
jgi:hypothetical protein